MRTDLIEINAAEPQEEAIVRAAEAIRRGEIVAIPTDTLYAIVADPFSLRAAGKVFAAKGRESSRSLPILVEDYLMGEELSSEINTRYTVLARRFWPGPLTMIVPASARIPLRVTGMTGRLALRQSSAPTVTALIAMLGQPLIATSANISGQPTCKSGIDVFGTMDGRVDLVLDGGTLVGAGATTVDITEPYWKVIREGDISEREIAEALQV